MKSQDIFLLLKLASLSQQEKGAPMFLSSKWEDWEEPEKYQLTHSTVAEFDTGELDKDRQEFPSLQDTLSSQYTVRALAQSTGISKSEVSLILQRCYRVGLAKPDRLTGNPRVNPASLSEFIIHGLRYVYPTKPAEITRGIATAWAAPVLKGQVMSAGDIVPVWPDPRGNTKGQAVEPLFRTVPDAVRRDARLYSLLALTDAIRIGQPRERTIANEKLSLMLSEKR
jgi:hypothetical protein